MTVIGINGEPLLLDPDKVLRTLPLVHGVRAFEDDEWMVAFGHHHPRRAIAVFNALYRRACLRWDSHPPLHPRWGASLPGGWPSRPCYPSVAAELEYRWWRLIDSCPDEERPGHRGSDDYDDPCLHCLALSDPIGWVAAQCPATDPGAFPVTIWQP
ncbi:hypothetical protein [Prauserella endophytica]|uniref:Uncharacterized protein n=1 Tax=Prauserella endophytica TaxID=1592324 RepID=A0ABY2RUU2_9PSEU|nr:hypothetical protein [Prauserella endophytica]TKG61501.1 hypothetical protein FCN18_33210 [Prauserella endophytica]